MTTPHGLGYVKMVIMVDEDVDPFNLPQVMWALSSKVNPAGDLVQLPNMSVLELDPGSSPARHYRQTDYRRHHPGCAGPSRSLQPAGAGSAGNQSLG